MARILLANDWPTALSTLPPCSQLTPSSARRARREHRHPKASDVGNKYASFRAVGIEGADQK
jgi:hypothetical protein